MRRHTSPPWLACRIHFEESLKNFVSVASVQESFHKKGHGKNKLAVGAAKD